MDEPTKPFLGNKRKVVYPEVITFPTSSKQVATIVEIGKRLNRRVVALCGGVRLNKTIATLLRTDFFDSTTA